MHLSELATITEATIEVEYHHESRRFTARLKGAEVMEGANGGVLASIRGRGVSPEMAQRDYAKQIKGKRIAFGGLAGPRREYNIPKSLSF